MKELLKTLPFRATGVYLLFSSLYILVSDRLLKLFITDIDKLVQIEIYKGLGFVLITGIFLFLDLRKRMKELGREQDKATIAHAALKQNEETYRNMAEFSPFAKYVRIGREIVYVNQACLNLFAAKTPDELIGKDFLDLFDPNYREINLQRAEFLTQIGHSVDPIEEKIIRMDGELVDVEVSISLFPYENQNAIHVILRDITSLKKAREKIDHQFSQLRALHDIDQAILNSFDLKPILKVSLRHVMDLLHVDAVNVSLRDNWETNEETSNHLGFNKPFSQPVIFDKDNIRFQKIIYQKERLVLPTHEISLEEVFNPEMLMEEGFHFYCGVPLFCKGKVKGILETFRKDPEQPSEEWFEFLEMISGQIAISIDNTQFYEGMRRSLLDLSIAYDKTIEGWSKALDLRDHETEGHSRRVTYNTILLAKKMGLDSDDLIKIRRGALLHDLGKLSIPDKILLKEGPLSPEEWEIMKRHPQIAFDMLQPIPYLRPALDIPYCHHEKWDGTGYPRGLQEEAIPLPARIFAVVDVYDALCSDRPYRGKWSEDKVLDYIRSQSGQHFDPNVVQAFFEIIDEIRSN